jgi:prepilin-type processing-associated H-X9-DG protein
MGGNTGRSIAQIEDGTTNTILLGELRVGMAESDVRGTWALGLPGASAMWMHGSDNDAGPNDCQDGGDSIRNGDSVVSAVGEATLRAECMLCDGAGGIQAVPRSNHPGGVHVAMCDGSVQFILNEVETTEAWNILTIEEMKVWQRLNAASDGLIVNLSEL